MVSITCTAINWPLNMASLMKALRCSLFSNLLEYRGMIAIRGSFCDVSKEINNSSRKGMFSSLTVFIPLCTKGESCLRSLNKNSKLTCPRSENWVVNVVILSSCLPTIHACGVYLIPSLLIRNESDVAFLALIQRRA